MHPDFVKLYAVSAQRKFDVYLKGYADLYHSIRHCDGSLLRADFHHPEDLVQLVQGDAEDSMLSKKEATKKQYVDLMDAAKEIRNGYAKDCDANLWLLSQEYGIGFGISHRERLAKLPDESLRIVLDRVFMSNYFNWAELNISLANENHTYRMWQSEVELRSSFEELASQLKGRLVTTNILMDAKDASKKGLNERLHIVNGELVHVKERVGDAMQMVDALLTRYNPRCTGFTAQGIDILVKRLEKLTKVLPPPESDYLPGRAMNYTVVYSDLTPLERLLRKDLENNQEIASLREEIQHLQADRDRLKLEAASSEQALASLQDEVRRNKKKATKEAKNK